MLIPILVAVAIIILAGLAIILVARLQQKNRSRTLQVEIRNLGNVQSHYELQASDPEEALKFRFALDGDELPQSSQPLPKPVLEYATPPKKAEGGKIADQALENSSIIASMLSTLGLLLPRSLGAPLTRAASQMQRGRVAASRVGQIKRQSSRLRPQKSAPSAGSSQPAAPGHQGGTTDPGEAGLIEPPWAQTPSVEPGEVLMADLHIRPARSPLRPWGGSSRIYPFTVLSRTAEPHDLDSRAPLVVAEASVQFVGTSWFLRILPYFVILAITLCLLVLTFLLAGAG